jgi:Hydrazine synthase alpha subunit middle domain
VIQGSDAGKIDNADIAAMRIVMMEPQSEFATQTTTGQRKWFNHINERMRILGEIPVRKTNANGTPVLDPEGNPDTSFWAKVPADTLITFQMLDSGGRVLTMAQTWHQVRPGEVRVDCGGCHAHSQVPLAFERTAAASCPQRT